MSYEKQNAPFELDEIEDVRIILKVKGKHYSVIGSGDKDDQRLNRIALVHVLLSDGHIVVTPALEDIKALK